MSEGDVKYEYELNLPPVICLVMGIVAAFIYVFGSNERRVWRRSARSHMGKWDFLLILWLVVKSCLFYALSTVTTAMASICTVAALRNKEYTKFFEEHGLTGILAAQLLLYNFLNISVFVRLFRKCTM